MGLKEELLLLEKELQDSNKDNINAAILSHTKAHLMHNKKKHAEAVYQLKKYNIEHNYFDNLDNAYK